jgi:hypothetical protein
LLVAGLVALVALIRTLQASPGTGVLAALVATATVLTGIAGLLIISSLR